MYYLTDFKHFVSIFPWFSIQLTPFSINFKFFEPSFLQKLRSDWVHFFSSCSVPGYRKFDEVPPRGGEDPIHPLSRGSFQPTNSPAISFRSLQHVLGLVSCDLQNHCTETNIGGLAWWPKDSRHIHGNDA